MCFSGVAPRTKVHARGVTLDVRPLMKDVDVVDPRHPNACERFMLCNRLLMRRFRKNARCMTARGFGSTSFHSRSGRKAKRHNVQQECQAKA